MDSEKSVGSRGEERPWIVVAEREQAPMDGVGLTDGLIFLHRVRWQIVVCWALLASAAWAYSSWQAEGASGMYRWSLVVQLENPAPARAPDPAVSIESLVSSLAARVAMATSGQSAQIDYLKMGSGSKAEVLRNNVVVSVTGPSDSEPPELFEVLQEISGGWARSSRERWIAQMQDFVAVCRERVAAARVDETVSVSWRAAEILGLAQAEALLRRPPEMEISRSVSPLPASRWAGISRTAGSLVAAMALVSLFHGWKWIASQARLRT